MTTEEFQKLVLDKLSSLEAWQKKLEKWQEKLEKWQTELEKWQERLEKWQSELEKWQEKLEKWQSELEKWQKWLSADIKRLREDFEDFREETRWEFDVTRKLINQAFERISDNLSYQDKVNEIEKILHTPKPRTLITK